MNADEIIQRLNLVAHPKERGFFIESYRSAESLAWESLPERYGPTRVFSTAIYFLIKEGSFSEMHRLKSDEIFHFYHGSPAEILILHPDGSGSIHTLGVNLGNNEHPQVVVPRGCWQGMRTAGKFTLMGCTVSPGFEYSDYESGDRNDLIQKYPSFRDRIIELTHSG